ncbi:HepT-like ribonuclease domain-containing protein [Demequina salsinemoris]|uniref:HepT-like ribonuclease domain-containing protein n=1 Tax=Demequina salsinemoris TaxID=577470 RepID=UPI000780F63F|nr:HepT-like ribonuclease domain-containing protein [Demequina salsinemoris]
MSRSVEQRIEDILDSIERCRRYVAVLDGSDSDVIDMAEDAIERNLQIIGEAASHLTAEVVAAHPEIAWPQIRGFRNILVHQYFGVDIAVIRDVVENYLPPLADAVRQHVESGEDVP